MKINDAILKIKNLNVEFPLFGGIFQREVSAVHAVKNVSLDIPKGKTIGVVGESGSGKSTLGKAIINVLRLTAPDVRLSGNICLDENNNEVDILSLSREEILKYRSKIQMIFQDPFSSLNPRMIVKDIIQEPLDLHTSLSKSEKKEKIDWLLEKVGLSKEQANRYPHEFSGGQRQRIGIARALATEPEIIIADEPVSALDVSIQAQVINLMMDLQEEFNLTIIFIAHDLSVVKHISSHVAVMYLGEIVEYNEVDKIFNNPQHEYTKTLLTAIPQPNPKGREERKKERLDSKKYNM
ncbi:MAG: peptide ABC transporter substrate-binding protein [Candidatus Marinimicrobia bacterium]|jgi:ABC-type oligopeptide transport system ATPase subunit|nr:peptide ABC transporter substrate-binding protein [Candidatus Neomarinimicrobiota bacterium]|tara:strand:- start:282 stop:1166 length:885 start_codon:yes stop_codon:yes gene_type:complete